MERYSFNPVMRTLVITEKFYEKMQKPKSDEFTLYKSFLSTIPDIQVIRKTHRTPSHYTAKSGKTYRCNPFKNLTYKNMEQFIRSVNNSEEFMKEYMFLKNDVSYVHTNRYAVVRKWFIAQFPKARENPLEYMCNSPLLISGKQFIEDQQSNNAA